MNRGSGLPIKKRSWEATVLIPLDIGDIPAAVDAHPGLGDGPFTLYGAYASLYTGKTRSYLRKKAIPFVERLPSHPHFRQEVSPTARSKRIPIVETPEGFVLQDTTVIFEYLERRFPTPSAHPPGPRQRLAAYLVDLFASENLKVAWHFRWNYPEPNRHFVLREFGRSFKPRGTDELLDHYGGVVARQMDGHRSRIGITPEMFPMMEQIYFNLLDVLEAHFTDHPYLFGGLPSIADFSLMGPLFAHLGRDPWPLHLMQQRAPRVFRWVEHMNTPEIQSPEFWDVPMAYLPDDEVPQTVVQLLQTFCSDYAPIYSATGVAYDQWLGDHRDAAKGTTLSQTDEDQPSLGQITVPLREHQMTMGAPGHSLWLLQRTLDWLAQLSPEDRAACQSFAKDCGAQTLLATPILRPLTRVGNRLAVA